MNGNEVVILGAFGCGAFANNSEVVALASKNVIAEYMYAFKKSNLQCIVVRETSGIIRFSIEPDLNLKLITLCEYSDYR